MIKKAVSLILSATAAVGFCTAGHKKAEPCVTHITEKISLPYVEEIQRKENLGKFRLTFYTPYEEGGKWGYQTATGVRSQHLKTCAVDPSVIPLGSTIEIHGNNGKVLRLKAVDIGGMVKGKSVDIFFDGGQREGYAFMQEFGEIHNVYLVVE